MNEQKTWHELVEGSISWQHVIQKKKFLESCIDCRNQQMELFANAFSRWRLNQQDPNYLIPLRSQIVDALTSINSAIQYAKGLTWLEDECEISTVLDENLNASTVYGWNVMTDTVIGSLNSYSTISKALISTTGSEMRYLEFKDTQAMDFGVVFEGGQFNTGKTIRVAIPCNTGMWLNVMASVVGKLVSYAGGATSGFKESQLGQRDTYSYNNQVASYTNPLAYDANWVYTSVETNGVECFLAAVTDGWSHNTKYVAFCEWMLKYYTLIDNFYSAMAASLNSDMSEESISKHARNWILSNIRNNCLWGNRVDEFLQQFNRDVGKQLISANA